MIKDDRFPDWMPYTAIIEGPDGRTYEQPFMNYEELVELVEIVFGDDYRVLTVF